MGVTIKTKKDKTTKITAAVDQLNGKGVEVGVLGGGEQTWLAGIHEYGMNIEVTPRMRAFLHNMGVHLKKTTTHIIIPERSFLRNGYDVNKEEIAELASDLAGDVLSGDLRATTAINELGRNIMSAIKDYANALRDPPNSDLTLNGSIDKQGRQGLPGKESSSPLVDSGDMIEAINYRKV